MECYVISSSFLSDLFWGWWGAENDSSSNLPHMAISRVNLWQRRNPSRAFVFPILIRSFFLFLGGDSPASSLKFKWTYNIYIKSTPTHLYSTPTQPFLPRPLSCPPFLCPISRLPMFNFQYCRIGFIPLLPSPPFPLPFQQIMTEKRRGGKSPFGEQRKKKTDCKRRKGTG